MHGALDAALIIVQDVANNSDIDRRRKIMNEKTESRLTTAYLFIAVIIFGHAVNDFKGDKYGFLNDIRVVPALISAIAWPLYLSYKLFDDKRER